MAKVNLLTQAEYAAHRGCSAVAVHKAIKGGRISLIDGKIDATVADIQWRANTRARQSNRQPDTPAPDLLGAGDSVTAPGAAPPPSAAAATPPAPVDNGYSEARTRRERAEAEEAEMRTAKMRGAMLMRDDVDRAMFEIGRELRDRLTACARRVAAEVASVTTAEGCETIIDREHRIVLELLVSSFREKIGAPARGGA